MVHMVHLSNMVEEDLIEINGQEDTTVIKVMDGDKDGDKEEIQEVVLVV